VLRDARGVGAVLNCCLGVCKDRSTGSDNSDPEEIGQCDGVPPTFESRFFRSEDDAVGRRLAIDGPRDKGMGGRLFSRSQSLAGALCGVGSATSGVIGPSRLCVDELDGVLT